MFSLVERLCASMARDGPRRTDRRIDGRNRWPARERSRR
ncbi:hypothetical protein NJ7G_0475 [Natrinema sp. J7-2]|nr:hypothetical protein NJ7G_0475 [Natrinema sp. J7-2]